MITNDFALVFSIFLVWACLPRTELQPNDHQLDNNEFIVIWNVPIHKCARLNISMDLWKYDIVYNAEEQFIGDNMTIFYKIGKFPYISESGEYINGGLPQLGNITAHIKQVKLDIIKAIPNPDYQGYAVIDWENWRPEWHTNWKPFDIYRHESIKLIKSDYPALPNSETIARAVHDFEFYARLYMQITIMIGRILRPNGHWGYYGFPDCYNYESLQKYCSAKTMQQNDNIDWLFSSSSTLYPSIYIGENNRNAVENAVYVYGRLHEARRIARKFEIPILPYSNIHYREAENFMKKSDLLITVGQAAALGFPGIVLWGGYNSFNSKEKCEKFQRYVYSTLGPTLKQIRTVLRQKPYNLEFPDALNESSWMDILLNFYA